MDYFIQSSIDNAENEEELDTEVKIFQNALDFFSSIKIRDCIVPRTEVVAVDLTTSLDELKNRFIESGISKIIVYDGNIDNVVGYIHSSEMFRAPKDWHDNVKDVPIVPETCPLQTDETVHAAKEDDCGSGRRVWWYVRHCIIGRFGRRDFLVI